MDLKKKRWTNVPLKISSMTSLLQVASLEPQFPLEKENRLEVSQKSSSSIENVCPTAVLVSVLQVRNSPTKVKYFDQITPE
jgi:hypothetical protein